MKSLSITSGALYDIDDIIYFLECPLKYHFYSQLKKLKLTPDVKKKLQDVVKQTAFHLYYRLLVDQAIPSFAYLADNFNNLWYPVRPPLKNLLPYLWGGYADKQKYAVQGMESLYEFYQHEKQKEQFVIAVNQDFVVEAGDVHLKGCFDLIREVDNILEVVLMVYNPPAKINLERDIRLTAISYAFHHLYKLPHVRLNLFSLQPIQEIYTTRNVNDYLFFNEVVARVVTSIQQASYYPRISSECAECFFHFACQLWPNLPPLAEIIKTKGAVKK
ncbi:hypothetical protein MTAT_04450 [Moorella thermoacetica]|uniref:PD-(D/E)XK endonuclease-like domain-containing protein n=1 Tax=Neomoorella thermoacetica TaxID=1525 RepID=A0AAC9HKF1_NEOTH|nr:hypothetical protein [Moorella thermoacetica]AOQ24756.1 hypothetical protein Maut_02328 [Moorella thermoacetica]TYL15706.1 hypothetical protein MTAT_04450 [Moorella thermoacetica]